MSHTNMLPCNGEVENGYCKENLSDVEENQEELDQSSLLNIGKPPRNVTGIRHCISQATLAGTSVLVSRTQFSIHYLAILFCQMRIFYCFF